MGLFGSDTYPCTVCGSEVTPDDGGRCSRCDAAYHSRCLKNIGNVKKESNLIRSDKIKVKCPNCGNVGNW